jgi:hypothetical protein
VRERYRLAARLAIQWLDRLAPTRRDRQLGHLRAFYRADIAGRLSLLLAL